MAKSRRGVGPVAAVVVVLAIGTVTALVTWRVLNDPGAASTAPPNESRAGGPAGEGEPSPPDRTASPAAVLSQTTVTRIEGTLERVVDRISFRDPRSVLVLRNPARTGVTEVFQPRIQMRWVRTDNGRQPLRELVAPGGTVTVRLGQPTASLALGYSVTHAVVRSEPSTAGRALALVTPLRMADATAPPRSVEVHAPAVRNLGCVQAVEPMVACGVRTTFGWSVTPSQQVVDVVAQLDLPSR